MTEGVPHSDDTVLDVDVPCVACNYNLRGLSESALCPECGTAVSESGGGSSLRDADVGWLKRLRLSLALQVWGIPLLVVVACIVHWLEGRPSPVPSWALLSVWGLWYAAWAYLIVATLLLTTQEPRLSFEERLLSVRRLLRYWVIVVAAGATLLAVSVVHQRLRGPLGSAWATVVVEVMGTGCLLLTGLYLSRFADRIGSRRLKVRTINITVVLVALVLVTDITNGLAYARGWDLSNSGPLGTLLLGAVGIAGIVYLIRLVLLLFEYRRELGKAYQAARELRIPETQARATKGLESERGRLGSERI